MMGEGGGLRVEGYAGWERDANAVEPTMTRGNPEIHCKDTMNKLCFANFSAKKCKKNAFYVKAASHFHIFLSHDVRTIM